MFDYTKYSMLIWNLRNHVLYPIIRRMTEARIFHGAIGVGPSVDRSVELPIPDGIQSTNPITRLLSGFGAVNFDAIADSPDMENLSQQEKDMMTTAFISKVGNTLVSGHFGDLRGAVKVMKKLDITIEFPEEFWNDIGDMLPKLNMISLSCLGMSQPSGIGEYNISGARNVLRNSGFSAEQLTDDYLMKILNYRHVLIALMERRMDERMLKQSLPNLLSSGSI